MAAQPKVDEALYECELTSSDGEDTQGDSSKVHRFQLRLVVPPRLAPFEFPQDAQVGMKLVLTCSALEGQQPISFVWLKDNQIIKQQELADQQQLHHDHQEQPSVLSVTQANSLSQVHQQQLADKLALQSASSSASVGQKVAEYVILGAGFEQADELDAAAQRTAAGANRRPDKTLDETDEQSSKSSQRHLLLSLSDSNIRIKQADDYSILSLDKLELKHSGRYTCSAQNEAARVSHSSQLSINGEFDPTDIG